LKNKSKTGGKNLNRGRRKWFHKGEFIGLDIQSVIMTVLTMLTIAVTVVMGLLIYNRFKLSVKETNISSTEGIVDSVVEKMNSDLYNIRQISNAANYNIIQQYDVSSQEFNNQFSLLYEINSDKIQSLVLYNNEGKLMASEPISSEKKNVEIKKQDWFYNAKKEIENIHFSKPHLQNIFMDGTYKYNWVISLSRSVDINDGEEPISGILLVDMKYSIIEETFERINGNSNGVYYYLCDGNGDIIYHPRKVEIDRNKLAESNRELASYEDGIYELKLNGRKANYVISNMAYTGWKVVGVVPESTQIMSMNQFRYYIVITIIILLMMLLVVNRFISKRISKPIRELDESVKAYEAGGKKDIYVGGSSEIRHLGYSVQKSYRLKN
jgi:sensor histidine kinase YesM